MGELFDISKHNPSKVIVAGDWHRNPYATWPKRVVEFAAQNQIDTILHVGDFGYNYGSTDAYSFEKPLHEALQKNDVKLVWIDGNHENHEMLRDAPRLSNGFVQTGKRGNIFYAPRGQRWTWSGRDFGALGGAWSPNGERLKEGLTVFKDLEQPTWDDLGKLGDSPLDYLITHDAPERVALKSILGIVEETPTRKILQKAVDTTKPSRVFSGHWHRRLDYRLPRADGLESMGHILDKEWTPGNIVILDLILNELTAPPAEWTTYQKSN